MCENNLSAVFFALGASTTKFLVILLQRPGLSVSSVGPSRNVSNCVVIVTTATVLRAPKCGRQSA
jgi:uncharacterized membrane protein